MSAMMPFHTSPAGSGQPSGDDLSALAWVQGELRKSLESAHKALRRYVREAESLGGSDVDAVDPGVLRTARAHLHQGVGALELVGLPIVAHVLRASEAAVQRCITKPKLADAAAVEAVERASFAVMDYLGRVLSDKPVSALALFPQYAAVQALAGAERVHPADLWAHDWQWRTLPPDATATAHGADDTVRGEMEALVLATMRQAEKPLLRRLSDLCAGVGAATAGKAGTLWQLAAAFFEGQAAGLIHSDVYTKRIASRLLAVLRAAVRGEPAAPDRLALDLLFYGVRARLDVDTDGAATPRLAALQSVWPGDDAARIDYASPRLGLFDPTTLQQARRRVVAAKDAWSAVAGGELARLSALVESMALLADSVRRLFPGGEPLAQALQDTAAQIDAGQQVPPAPVAMEVATSVLYLDAVLEDGELDLPVLSPRLQRLAQRVRDVAGGATPQPLEPWMEELYRRISDRQTMGSVVQELRASLSEVEKQIDQYFREPARPELLLPVPGQLSSMRSVLSVLGMDQAAMAVLRMRDDVGELSHASADEAAGVERFERLADNLGALSFLIDMLSVQPQMAKTLFRFDAATGNLSAVMGQSERPSSFAPFAATALAADATPAFAPTALMGDVPPPPAPVSAPAPMFSLAPSPAPAVAQTPPPAAAPAPVTPPAPASGLEDDAEMREIFLEEAREVLEAAHLSLTALREAGENVEEATSMRRAFHTLKGSSRMVGLKAFGDAAWSCEQLYNARLAQNARIDGAHLSFTADALGYLGQWVEAIAAGSDGGHDAAAVSRAADALRVDGTQMAIAAPAPAPAEAPAEPVAEPRAEPPAEAAAPAATLRTLVPDLPSAADLELPALPPLAPSAAAPAAAEEVHFELDLGALDSAEPAAPPAPAMPVAPEVTELQLDDLPLDFGDFDRGAQPTGVPAPTETPETPPEAEVPDLADVDLALPADETPAADTQAPQTPEPLDVEGVADMADAPESPELLDLTAMSEASAEPEAADTPDEADLPAMPEPVMVTGPADLDDWTALEEWREPDAPAETDAPDELTPMVAEDEGAADVPAEGADATAGDAEADAAAPTASETESGLQADPEFEAEPEAALDLPLDVAPEVVDWAVDLEPPAAPVAPPAAWAVPDLADAAPPQPAPALDAPPAPEPEPELALEPEAEIDSVILGNEEEPVKVVGPLRIAIPLFNIFLNEADEQSRRLGTELAEWTLEDHRPVGETAVALAHSLAGNSATVGYAELSALARTLEHALQRSRELGAARAGEAVLFSDVAEEIRRLLHQFAAGFLKPVQPELLQRLAEHEAAQAIDERDTMSGRLDADETDEADADGLPPALPVPPLPAASAVAEDDDIDIADAIDPDLFPIFEEEAEELLPQLRGRLAEWARHPSDAGAGAACMRTLHTFKGGARLAGAMRVGEMAHRLETEIEHLAGHGDPGVAAIEHLLGRADAMATAFERLRHPSVAPMAPAAPVPDATPDVPAPSAADRATLAALADAAAAEPEPEAPVAAEADAADRGAVDSAEAPAPAAMPRPAAEPAPAIDWARFATRAEAEDTPAPLGADQAPAAAAVVASVRVRAPLLDRLVNHAGEVSITRARIESDMRSLQGALNDLTDNLDRLRSQLRDIELQAETQISSRMEAAKAAAQGFDPLEMDRFTRFQEITRMMAESVNDVATVQRTLQRTLQSSEDELAAQARLTRELQDDLLRTRMVEFESLADRLYRVVRQAAKDTGKAVRLDLAGGAIEVDRGVLERMVGPFEHLLRNCVAHGIEPAAQRRDSGKDETGSIQVGVLQHGNEVAVEVRDDGGGLDLARIRARGLARGLIGPDESPSDEALAQLIFVPGFSTAETVSGLAGRGVGMDVVRAEVTAMGGRIETASVAGQGTTFRVLLPLTTAVTQVVMLRIGSRQVAVPSTLVEVVRRATPDALAASYASGQYPHAGGELPFFWLGALLRGEPQGNLEGRSQTVIVFASAGQRVAVHVDEVLGNQEVVVKNLGPQLARLPGLAGITLLPSGAVATIYNPVALANVYGADARSRALGAAARAMAPVHPEAPAEAPARLAPMVMVVDDSLTVRRVTQRLLAREGYRVVLAKDGLDAVEKLAGERPAVLLSDIEMPRMDGFDLVRNVRADPRLADLPVIMITSRIAQKHRDYAAELGVEHYLGKPYGEDELLALVGRYAGADIAL